MARLRHYLAAVRDIIGFIRREKCISFFVLHREQQGRVPSACIARLASTHSSSQRVEREREEKRSYRGSVGGNHAAHNLHVPAGNEELWPRPELFARRGKTPRLRSTKAKARFRVAFRFIREKSSFYQFPSIHPGSRRRVKERSSSSSHVHQQPRGRQQPFVA